MRASEGGGDTATGKPDQPYRIAGTLNFPDERKRSRGRVASTTSIVDASGPVHTLDDLREAHPAQPRPAEIEAATSSRPVGDLLACLSDKRRADLAQVIEKGAPGGGRSGHFQKVTGWLKGDGFSADECEALWRAFPEGAGVAKYVTDRTRDELARWTADAWCRATDVAPDTYDASVLLGASEQRPSPSVYTAEPFDIEFYGEISAEVFKEELVEGLKGHPELSVLYGAPGSGKSVLVGDAGCHIAGGLPWFGRAVKQGAVLYVAAERPALVKRRFAAFRKHHRIDDLPIGVISGYFDMAKSKRDTDRIIATITRMRERTGQDVVALIIDTKSQVVGDDNSSADMPAFVANVARIMATFEISVIVIDHSAFWAPKKMRGHTSLLGAADTTILVEKAGDVRTATIEKANDAPEGERVAFTLESVSLGTHPKTGKPTTAPVVVPARAPEPERKNAGYLTASEKIALDALKEAIIDHGERGPRRTFPILPSSCP